MNLRDKLRGGAAEEPQQAGSDDVWGAAPAPEVEAPAKPAKGKAKPAAKPAAKGAKPALDVNKRFMMLAGAAAFMTAIMGAMYLNKSAAGLSEGGTKINVVVLGEDVQRGSKLTEERLSTAEIPKAYLPTGYIEVGEDEKGLKEAQKMVALAPMVAGEPLIAARVSPADRKLGIAYLLRKGERAKTINVDSASGLAGLIKPGNEVDLLTTIPDPNDDQRRLSTAVIQKARVIAVGSNLFGEVRSEEEEQQDLSGGIQSDSTITLALPQNKVHLAALCEDLGLLKVVLRAEDDTTVQKQPFSDEVIMSLLSGSAPQKPAAKPVLGKPVIATPIRRWTPPVRRDPPPRPVVRHVPPPQPRPVVKPVAPKPPVNNTGSMPQVIHFGGVTGQGGNKDD